MSLHTFSPERSNRDDRPIRLLGVWAHPDDEAYLSASLMSEVIEAGGEVTVLALTDGEAGFSADDPRSVGERRRLRRAELRAALAAVGVHDVRFLGAPDGRLHETPAEQIIAAICVLLAEVRPERIVTFGPDGITGHSDHVVCSNLTTSAWLSAGTGELWYAAKTAAWLDEWRDLHDEFDVMVEGEPTGVSADAISEVVDAEGALLDRKRAALACHASQTEAISAAFGEDRYRRWIAQETFRQPTPAELAEADRSLGSSAVG